MMNMPALAEDVTMSKHDSAWPEVDEVESSEVTFSSRRQHHEVRD